MKNYVNLVDFSILKLLDSLKLQIGGMRNEVQWTVRGACSRFAWNFGPICDWSGEKRNKRMPTSHIAFLCTYPFIDHFAKPLEWQKFQSKTEESLDWIFLLFSLLRTFHHIECNICVCMVEIDWISNFHSLQIIILWMGKKIVSIFFLVAVFCISIYLIFNHNWPWAKTFSIYIFFCHNTHTYSTCKCSQFENRKRKKMRWKDGKQLRRQDEVFCRCIIKYD